MLKRDQRFKDTHFIRPQCKGELHKYIFYYTKKKNIDFFLSLSLLSIRNSIEIKKSLQV